MSRLIEISDELFSEASRIAAQQSEEAGTVIERWANVGMVFSEAMESAEADQIGPDNVERHDVIRRMKQFMGENPVEGADIKRLIDEGRS